ncbi:MAG: MopE-related protein [Pseudomonadota bacterium]
MSRAPLIWTLLPLCGCPFIDAERALEAHDPDGDGTPWYEVYEEWGLDFRGAGACMEVDAARLDLSQDFTLELYLQASPSGLDPAALFPVLSWGSALAIYQWQGATWIGPGDGLGEGVAVARGFVDSARHHLLVSRIGGSQDAVFLDGRFLGYGIAQPGEADDAPLYFGCWPAQEAQLPGVIGALRLQDAGTSTAEFTPAWEPLAVDDHTLALWQLDEGGGAVAEDAGGLHAATLTAPAWVHFDLACLDPALNCGPYPEEIPDADADGYPEDEDCDDGERAVHPGAGEACDGRDDDCDGLIDGDDPEADCARGGRP